MENIKKLKMEILNEKNQVVNEFTSQRAIVAKLVELLWSKTVVKTKNITRIHYNYNYSDYQNITFYLDTKYKFIFYNIPTNWGSIKDYAIVELLKLNDEEN